MSGTFFFKNYDSGHPDERFGTPNMGIAKFFGRTASNTTYWPHCAVDGYPELLAQEKPSFTDLARVVFSYVDIDE